MNDNIVISYHGFARASGWAASRSDKFYVATRGIEASRHYNTKVKRITYCLLFYYNDYIKFGCNMGLIEIPTKHIFQTQFQLN